MCAARCVHVCFINMTCRSYLWCPMAASWFPTERQRHRLDMFMFFIWRSCWPKLTLSPAGWRVSAEKRRGRNRTWFCFLVGMSRYQKINPVYFNTHSCNKNIWMLQRTTNSCERMSGTDERWFDINMLYRCEVFKSGLIGTSQSRRAAFFLFSTHPYKDQTTTCWPVLKNLKHPDTVICRVPGEVKNLCTCDSDTDN